MAQPTSVHATGALPTPTPATAPAFRTASWRIYALLAFGIFCIAFSAILTRWAQVPGTVSAFYRVLIAVVALALPFSRRVARRQVARSWHVWGLALGAGIFFALDLALWNTSLFMTPVATATLLGNDAPIIVGLVALLVFRERLGRWYWVGLALALVGMGVIVGGDAFSRSSLGAGDLLALIAGVSYAMYLLITQRIRAHMDTLSSLWIPAVSGMLLLLIINLVAHHALWGFSGQAYLALLTLGLTSQVVGWLAINYVLGLLPASIVSPTLLGQPVLTAVLAVPLLGEALGPREIVGGIVALVGIYLVNRGAVH